MTTTNIYIASPEGANGRNVVAYGVLKALTTKFKTTVFRPAVSNHDHFTPILLNASNAGLGVALSTGLDIHQVRKDKEGSRGDIVAAFNDAMNVSRADAALIVGTDKSHVNDPTAYEFNANIAADLQAASSSPCAPSTVGLTSSRTPSVSPSKAWRPPATRCWASS